jgi:CHAT domain-containing protein/tetratricopeptide (TPR) repeat protein
VLKRARAEFQQGEAYRREGNLEAALRAFESAAEGFEVLGIPGQKAVCLNECGRVLRHLDRAGDALALLREAEVLLDDLSKVPRAPEKIDKARVIVLHNLGGALRQAYLPEEGLVVLERALDLCELLEDPLRLADIFNGLGACYRDLRLQEEAEAVFTEAKAYAQGDLAREAQALNNLGAMAHDRYDHVAALKYIQAARERYEQVGDARLVAVARLNAARQLIDLGDLEAARNELQAAASVPGVGSSASLSAPIYSSLARILELSQNLPAAQEAYEKARELFSELGDLRAASTVTGMIGATHLKLGNDDLGLRLVQESIDMVEKSGDSVLSADLRSQLHAHASDLYGVQVEAELALVGAEAAFVTAERAKARALLLALRSGPDTAPAHSEAKSEKFLDDFDPDKEHSTLERVRATLAYRRFDRREAGEVKGEVPGLGSLQEALDDLQADMVSFLTTDTSCFAFVVTGEGVSFYRLPEVEDLVDLVREFRSAIANGDFSAVAASELYRHLLEPAARKLSKPELVIVPDGPLHLLPFSALLTQPVDDPVAEGSFGSLPYLIRDKRVRLVPSAAILVELKRNSGIPREVAPPKRIAVIAGPDDEVAQEAEEAGDFALKSIRSRSAEATNLLRGAEEEASRIKSLVSGLKQPLEVVALREGKATWRAVKSLLEEEFDVVHFACHGYADDEMPWLSGLQLVPTEDRATPLVRAYELQNLRLRSRLVVLSACESGYGRVLRGEGVLGLNTALLRAGASTLCVSLWSIFDQLTPEIMETFYVGLLRGMTSPEALQRAQLKALDKAFDHPAVWAPLVIIGAE